jgi:hypothetical protein
MAVKVEVEGYLCRPIFEIDGVREPVELGEAWSLVPEPTPAGTPAVLDRVTIEVTDSVLAQDILRVGTTGYLSVSRPDVSFAHDYGYLRIVYSEPTVRANAITVWTIILEPVRAD